METNASMVRTILIRKSTLKPETKKTPRGGTGCIRASVWIPFFKTAEGQLT